MAAKKKADPKDESAMDPFKLASEQVKTDGVQAGEEYAKESPGDGEQSLEDAGESKDAPDPVPGIPQAPPVGEAGSIATHEDAAARYRAECARRRIEGDVDSIDLGGKGPQRAKRQMEMIRLELHHAMNAARDGKDPVPFISRAIGISQR